MKPHRKIAGHIKPEGHILFLPGHGIALCKLIQKGLGFDKPKEIGLKDLTGRFHIIKVSVRQSPQDEGLVFLEDHQVHPS